MLSLCVYVSVPREYKCVRVAVYLSAAVYLLFSVFVFLVIFYFYFLLCLLTATKKSGKHSNLSQNSGRNNGKWGVFFVDPKLRERERARESYRYDN